MSNLIASEPLRLPNLWAGPAALFAHDCVLCAAPSGGALVCGNCERALPWMRCACDRCAAPVEHAGVCGECLRRPPVFDGACAAFEYRFPIDRLVLRFKSAGDLALGRWLAARMLDRVRDLERPHRIVAPPLSAARLRTRGFNQAVEIAKHVGRGLAVRADMAALEKVRDTPPQQGLSRRERRANLRTAFRCRRRFDGEDVALVDDVVTTGATADTIARLLKRAGAARVFVWALARTPGPGD